MMKTSLRISFLLPGAGRQPVGGFKIVYEYANRLSRRGHKITIIHPALLREDASLSERVVSRARYLFHKVTNNYKPEQWFPVDPAVRLLWVPSLEMRYIPDGDVVVATAWETAEWAATYSTSKGKGYYLIQHLETWNGLEDRVLATWQLPLIKMAISPWLMKVAETMNQTAFYLPNGLDFQKFTLIVPPAKRTPSSVMMLYHLSSDKGSADGLSALAVVQSQIPSLRVTLFGTSQRPRQLPQWAEYHRCPGQAMLCELYNRAAVFVAPSWTEGWGLPPSEAMACGTAVAATDIGGHRTFAIADQTALLSPPKQPDRLAANIFRLITDDSLRYRIAIGGNRHIQTFTWDKSLEALEGLLLKN